jgi:hypothetical protein
MKRRCRKKKGKKGGRWLHEEKPTKLFSAPKVVL